MVTNQAYLFLIFIINGIIIGLLFDFFRILRRTFSTNDFVTYIQDIIFWILTGLIILYFIYIFNNGEIRLFLFLGIFIGLTLYILLASSYVIKINVAILTFFKKIFQTIFKYLLLPFKFIYQTLKKIFIKPISFIIVNIRKISIKTFITTNKTKKIKNNT